MNWCADVYIGEKIPQTHLRPPNPSLLPPLDYGSQPPTKTPIAIISGMAKATHFKFSMQIHRVDQNKSASKQCGKIINRHSQEVSKTFRANIYKAHHMVIFATVQLSFLLLAYKVTKMRLDYHSVTANSLKKVQARGKKL